MRLDPDPVQRQKYLCVCSCPDDGFSLAGDTINCILIPSLLWMQFMIVTKTPVNTVCMYVVIVGLTIAPLLETRFAMAERCPHMLRGLLRADAPFVASPSDHPSWCGNVMYRRGIRHRSIFVSVSVLSLW